MSLTIELHGKLEEKIRSEAHHRGIQADKLAADALQEVFFRDTDAEEVVASLRTHRVSAKGKYAGVPFTTEDLHRERQHDRQCEENKA